MIEFRKVSKESIPEGRKKELSAETQYAIEQLMVMSVGDTLLIPIGEATEGKPELVKGTVGRYGYFIRKAASKVPGNYKILQRGVDLYVVRTA